MIVETGAKSGPLYHRLSTSIAELIDRGELPPLAVLPSERALADALLLSRTTVVTAYQTLREAGRLERRRGSGTWVRSGAPGGERETVSGDLLAGDHVASPFLNGPLATIDFANAALPSLDLVADVAAGLTHDDYRRLGSAHHGYHPRGLPALRERVAGWYSGLGTPTTPDEVLITSGAQQALELIARGCLQPGDGVVVEEPTYRGALEAFAHTGSRIRTVRADQDGMDVGALEQMLAARTPRLVYVQAVAHNPTGAVLAEERRRRLAAAVQASSAVLVDDTSLAGTVFRGPAPAPILGSGDRIVTVGSMSKLFWGGLRIGWIRASARVTSRLAQVKGVTDLGTSLVSQEIALRLLDRVDEAAAARRESLAAGFELLTGLLSEHLPDWTWREPRAGASLWVRLPNGDATHLAQVALRFGVALLPGAVFSADRHTDDHTRLPYALPPEVLREGVLRLARAWRAYAEGGLREVSLTTAIT
ncbi:PLP-dependent aminotransferase family protein [Jiangella asiatica]|uniref:PLP-dependent aminotransferase family protein n=2 Tax=Jiangella asiatica TaxID=2530372 RepID=A0A4R5CUD2_9ACTN|nr:PLP-dependent aminotransferase family protein [Jiangella asiatica]